MRLIAVSCLLLAFAGCGKTTDQGSANGTGGTLPELTGEVKLDVASWDEIEKHIAEQNGKVVVVDLWSSWCEPCKKEFPDLVRLQRKHLKDVVCLSVNLDFDGSGTPEDRKPAVKKFLDAKGAKFQHFVSSVVDEDLYGKLEIAAIPAIFVYDKTGKLAKKFTVDSVTPEKKTGDEPQEEVNPSYDKHVEPLVEELLKK